MKRQRFIKLLNQGNIDTLKKELLGCSNYDHLISEKEANRLIEGNNDPFKTGVLLSFKSQNFLIDFISYSWISLKESNSTNRLSSNSNESSKSTCKDSLSTLSSSSMEELGKWGRSSPIDIPPLKEIESVPDCLDFYDYHISEQQAQEKFKRKMETYGMKGLG